MASIDALFESFLPYANLERGQSVGVFRLDRMRTLCELTGMPQDSFKTIHVAGSKGKGSLCALLASILEEGGEKTGLYASPHLLDYSERISLAGKALEPQILLAEGEKITQLLKDWEKITPKELGPPTFFELITLLAFLSFRAAGCSWAVIETGLGGRLDSTNVIIPQASVITSIELEHTEYLGSTLAAIAGEKAGIIKAGRPVFSGRMKEEARSVIRARAESLGCPYHYGEDVCGAEIAGLGWEGMDARLEVRGQGGKRRELALRMGLLGRVQAENAALAALVIDRIRPDIGDPALCRGISSTRLPGRFQLIDTRPPLVIDGSHTPDSLALCLETWIALAGPGGSLVFGCAADKDVAAMAALARGKFERIIITGIGSFKASNPEGVLEAFQESSRGLELELAMELDLGRALSRAREGGRPSLVCGSFYLAGLVLRLFRDS